MMPLIKQVNEMKEPVMKKGHGIAGKVAATGAEVLKHFVVPIVCWYAIFYQSLIFRLESNCYVNTQA